MGLSGMSHCVENERKMPGEKTQDKMKVPGGELKKEKKMGLSGMSHCVENESAREGK